MKQVNLEWLEQASQSKPTEVVVERIDQAEMDEMWSFVGKM